jgi:hypothetical protein
MRTNIAVSYFDARSRRCARSSGGREPTLVSVHAFDDEGVHAILEVFAEALANGLGLPHASGIVQANIVGHTGADGYARLARQPAFRNRLAEKEPTRDRGLREEDPESGVTPIRARRDAGPVRCDEGPVDAGPSVSTRSDAAPLGQGGTKANDRSAAALGTEATRLPS